MEESELHEVLQHTMANINGKAYRTMVGQLFAQNTSPVMDYTYDIDLHKVNNTKHKNGCYSNIFADAELKSDVAVAENHPRNVF